MKKRYILLITFLLFANISTAQKENNIWYFGQKAGLDFNSGNPVPLTNGVLNTWEGCASVADKYNGQLLFYSDGVKVWNKNHATMPNGTGLWGEKSSTQSAHIVPKPGSDSLYYIFTTDAGTSGFPNKGKMAFSVVDMSLAAGLGDVTVKNVALFDTTSEQLTSTLHANGCYIWVLAHEWKTDAFYAFLVTDTGIVTTPVISHVGSIHNCAYFGQMKVSPDGKKLALPLPCTTTGLNYVELFDFDHATGQVSGFIPLLQDHLVYGLEFSPGSQFLYVVDHNNSSNIIYKQTAQYNVSLDSASVLASRIIVGKTWNATTFFGGAAQLAPDGKIYVVPTGADSLSVIHDPDSAGLACNFVVAGLYLGGKLNDHGLPGRIVTSIISCTETPPVSIAASDSSVCEKFCINFFDQSANNPVLWLWSFQGASPATSTDQNPEQVCYDDSGTFDVTLVTTDALGNMDTLQLSGYITVFPNPFAPLITQVGNVLTSSAAGSYQWYLNGTVIPGATDQSYEFTQGGLFTVVITDENGCSAQADYKATATGLEELSLKDLRIYPNPSSGRFTIEFPGFLPGEEISVRVWNVMGQEVFAREENISPANRKLELRLNGISAGVYFLSIQTMADHFLQRITIAD